jgi:hypothetical protein
VNEGGGRGKGREQDMGGEMTQTFYAHMNKRENKKERQKSNILN